MDKQTYVMKLLKHYRELRRQAMMLMDAQPGPQEAEQGAPPEAAAPRPGRTVSREQLAVRTDLVGAILEQAQAREAEDAAWQTGRLLAYELDRLNKAVMLLDRVERQAITMRYLEGRTMKCVGAALSLAPSTVDHHIRKGAQELAYLL